MEGRAACVVAGVFLAAGAAAAQPSQDVQRVLARLEGDPPASQEEVVEELRQMGRRAIAPLVEALTADMRDFEGEGEPPAPLTEPQRTVAVDALRALRDEGAVTHVAGAARTEAALPVRVRLVEILAWVGDHESVGPFLDSVEALDPVVLVGSPFVRGPIERALAELLRRDRAVYPELARAWPRRSAPARSVIAGAAAAEGSAEGVRLLGEILEGDPSLAAEVIRRLGEMGRPGALIEVPRRLREYLSDSDPTLREAACFALGKLGDGEAVDGLVPLLEDADPRVARASHWALQEICGARLPATPERWRSWLEEENAWLEREGDAVFERVRSGAPADACDALRVLSSKRLFRHRVAEEVATALSSRPEPEVRRAVCDALARLGSARAVESLIEALREADRDTRVSILGALRAITGEDLMPDYEIWRAWLERQRG